VWHEDYRIRVIDGDPVFVYFGIVDAPRPYAARVNGDGAITITNTVTQNIALRQIVNAEPATWAALPTIEQGSTDLPIGSPSQRGRVTCSHARRRSS
jgi:hypothetical protein